MPLSKKKEEEVIASADVTRKILAKALEECDDLDVPRPVFVQSALIMSILIMRHGLESTEKTKELVSTVVDDICEDYEENGSELVTEDPDVDVQKN